MTSLNENDIYFHTQIKRRVSLNPRYLDENFTSFIEKIVKNTIEGKCIKEGYVVPGTVVILERSMGNLNNNQFNGNILFDLKIGAKVCNIPVNSVIRAPVKKINKLGILAKLGPLMILAPKEIHSSKDPFKDIKPGMEIELLVIGKTFDLNSKEISVYAKLNTETKKKMIIPMRKMADKHKNTNKFLATESILEEEEEPIESDDSEEKDESDLEEESDEESEVGSEEDEEDADGDADGEIDRELSDDESIDLSEAEDAPPEELISDESEEEEDDEDEDDEEEDEIEFDED